jgi:hypothetical protein
MDKPEKGVPELVASLVRRVARAFYRDEHVVVLDWLVRNPERPFLRDDDLKRCFDLPERQVRSVLAELFRDKLVCRDDQVTERTRKSGYNANVDVELQILKDKREKRLAKNAAAGRRGRESDSDDDSGGSDGGGGGGGAGGGGEGTEEQRARRKRHKSRQNSKPQQAQAFRWISVLRSSQAGRGQRLQCRLILRLVKKRLGWARLRFLC